MRIPPPPPHPSKALGYEFRAVVIEHVSDGSFHVIAPWVKTDEEAKRLARMTWPDEKLWRLVMRRDAALKTLKCSICARVRYIAYGNNAMQMTMPQLYRIARRLGWLMNPTQVCENCRQGILLSPDERKEYHEMLDRCERNGNDGADIYEIEEFCRAIERKYLKPFKELL